MSFNKNISVTTKTLTYPRVIAAGETAFTVEYGNTVDIRLNTLVHALDQYLKEHPVNGIIETVPTYRSLLVIYDPCYANPIDVQKALLAIATNITKKTKSIDDLSTSQLLEIPVRYGGEWGPDLADVAAHTHLNIEEVIRKHTQPTYQVAMLGFAPGFTYLLGLSPELSTPRLATPRVHVPPGSVGIAGNQTGLYALDTPGGWRIIGRTTLKLFDPNRKSSFLLQAGDRVKFSVVE